MNVTRDIPDLVTKTYTHKAPAKKALSYQEQSKQAIADMDLKLEGMTYALQHGVPYIDIEHETAEIIQRILDNKEANTDVHELLRYTSWETVEGLVQLSAKTMSDVSTRAWQLRRDLRDKAQKAYAAWQSEHALIFLDPKDPAVSKERGAVETLAKWMVVEDIASKIIPRPLELLGTTKKVRKMRQDMWRYTYGRPLLKLRASIRHDDAMRAWKRVPSEWHRVANQCHLFFIEEYVEQIPVIRYIKGHRYAYPINALYLVQMVLGTEPLVPERDIDRLRSNTKRASSLVAKSC